MKSLMDIPAEQRSFEANGRNYVIEDRLSVDRYKAYEKYQLEVTYAGGFAGTWQTLGKVIDCMNKSNFVGAAALVQNLRDSIITTDDRISPILEMCALFINREDEDRRIITDDMIAAKVADWTEAGVPMNFFLELLPTLLPIFSLAYEEITQSISGRKTWLQRIAEVLSRSKGQDNIDYLNKP